MLDSGSSSCRRDRKLGWNMDEAGGFVIGNQTAFSAPVLDPFVFAVEHGFDAFEFFPDGGPGGRGWSAEDVGAEDRRYYRTTAEEHAIRLSVHAALESDPIDEENRAKLFRDIKLARDLGACVVNLHLVPADIDAYCQATLSLVDVLAPDGMMLSLENTVPISPAHINQLFARLQSLDEGRARSIGLCLDMGHANLHAATHNNYLAYVDQLGSHVPIVHAHIHENWGDGDKHLTIFTGPAGEDPAGIAGLLRRLKKRRYRGALILEQWPAPAELLVTARDRLRGLQANGDHGGNA
jgi:sugar phosphate isomerase/epimerase